MLHVDLDNILTHDELAPKAEEVLRKVDEENKIMVITRNGRPAVAMLKLEELENLSGRTVVPAMPVTEHPATSGISASPDLAVSQAASPTPDMQSAPPMPQVQPAPNPSGLPDMPDSN